MAPKAVKKPTFDYIKEAILGLKERGGSSPAAIKAWIAKTYPGANIAPHVLKAAFKSGVTSGKLSKVSIRAFVMSRVGWIGRPRGRLGWGRAALAPKGWGVKVAGTPVPAAQPRHHHTTQSINPIQQHTYTGQGLLQAL